MRPAGAEIGMSNDFTLNQQQWSDDGPEVSVVLPCLNEAETLARCIDQIQRVFRAHSISGEIVVADNGSTDGSVEIAGSLGVRVVRVPRKGYGSALMGGISSANGRFIIMGDADCSYEFGDVPRLLEKLRQGSDLVMGNRFLGGIEPGAMPALHKYLGNPVLTWIGRLFFKAPCGDFHCGLRGFSKAAYELMDLRTTGMEFASEMVVKATLGKMRIAEVPTTLSPDRRNRPPHLRSWRDGWRHLRFLLLYSPRWLFLYPGLALMLLGTGTGLLLLRGPRIHTLLYAAMAVLVGFQSVVFAMFTKVFAISEGLLPQDSRLNGLFRYFRLETGLAAGFALIAFGLAASFFAVGSWARWRLGALDPVHTLRIVIPAAFSLTLGFQVVLSSFFLSVLGMKHRDASAFEIRSQAVARVAKQPSFSRLVPAASLQIANAEVWESLETSASTADNWEPSRPLPGE
jgi:glycosyltransferase involved in cell wall biosynthesis